LPNRPVHSPSHCPAVCAGRDFPLLAMKFPFSIIRMASLLFLGSPAFARRNTFSPATKPSRPRVRLKTLDNRPRQPPPRRSVPTRIRCRVCPRLQKSRPPLFPPIPTAGSPHDAQPHRPQAAFTGGRQSLPPAALTAEFLVYSCRSCARPSLKPLVLGAPQPSPSPACRCRREQLCSP